MGKLIRLLFPKRCFVCGKVGDWFCPSCYQQLPRSPCPIFRKDRVLDGVFSPFLYRGGVKRLIIAFKFEMAQELCQKIVKLILAEMKKTTLWSFFPQGKFIVVPLPLHCYRQRWRGFNQSALLAKTLAKKLKLAYSEKILLRAKFALPQVGLSQAQRKRNIKNQFVCFGAEETNFLIVDDIWTTGATLREAGQSLKDSGAKLVWGLTLCC